MTDYKQLCRKLADRLRKANEFIAYLHCEDCIDEKLLKEAEEALSQPDNTINEFIEKIIPIILYGDIDETPFEEIKDHCKLNEQGEIDWYAINDYDTEQQTRMAIAATLRGMKE